MALNPKIFKAYDIRGVYQKDLDEEGMEKIIRAIFTFFSKKLNKNNFTVGLGYDMRLSSPSLFKVAKNVFIEAGATVINLDLISTPSFYFAVSKYHYNAGVQITASHNPKEYAGLKFVLNTPQGLLKIGKPTGMQEIKQMAIKGVKISKSQPGTVIKKTGIVQDEIKNALHYFDNPSIKPFKIVADPANGMGAIYIQKLAKYLPIKLVKMNFDLDGSFPAHQADPMQPENLVDLQKRVLEEKADLGLAPDGDGDRLFIIDEKGKVVKPSIITSILAQELLKKYPGSKVIVDQKYYLTTKKHVEANGGELLISRTGHAYVTQLMNQTQAILGGEGSAHYFYREIGGAESQVMTIVGLLKMLSEQNKPLSEVADSFKVSYESGDMNFVIENVEPVLAMLRNDYAKGELSTLDGVAIDFPDWRLTARSSNTEPLLRVTVESKNPQLTRQKAVEITKKVLYHGGKLKTGGH